MIRIFICVLIFSIGLTPKALAHCEVPCGIYTDEMRVQMIQEHITTIEKAMKKIDELAADPTANANQLIRWVTTKEFHAQEIQHIVWQYFMTQRVKPPKTKEAKSESEYVAKLTLLHQMLIVAMKTKQSTDLGSVEKLRDRVSKFAQLYFGKEHRQP